MNNIMIAGEESTILEFIDNYESDTTTIDKCFLKQVINSKNGKLLINLDSILERYHSELSKYLHRITLSNEEYFRYRYNPKLLSYAIYGTTELWFLILHANELKSATEFNTRTPFIYDGSILRLIETATDLEKDYIDANEEMIRSELER